MSGTLPHPKKKICPLDRDSLQELWDELGSCVRVGERLGVSFGIANGWANELQIARRKASRRLKPSLSKSDLSDLMLKHKTASAVGRVVGRSPQTILNWMRFYGVKLPKGRHYSSANVGDNITDRELCSLILFYGGYCPTARALRCGHEYLHARIRRSGMKVNLFHADKKRRWLNRMKRSVLLPNKTNWLPGESWAPHPYLAVAVSDLGRVWSQSRRSFRALKLRDDDYLEVATQRLKDGTQIDRCVHLLVWETFCDVIPKGAQVHHGRGGRSDASLGNLSIKYTKKQHYEADEKRRAEEQVLGFIQRGVLTQDDIINLASQSAD